MPGGRQVRPGRRQRVLAGVGGWLKLCGIRADCTESAPICGVKYRTDA
ncbi:hypothetical protein [Psychromonas sp. CD1]|nr:hypothetical protein [Psychromonas sp. CD1]